MNNIRVTIAVLLATLVFTSTFSNSKVEAKDKIIISFKCKKQSECLTNIACEACVDCQCDNGLCRCHGFNEEVRTPTVAPLPA
ncbi:hypothetical protein EUTSA_v10023026mg [Eutrema salsugineum]|uniref:Uncharacterized protein n=1 Tax=Eutrema salsugineum TaxID=72664 RepID=V4NW37_EUTSA|nr:hypothetical protein EUTSA_v10023026mg [Eutrema salsugineum]